MNVLKYAFFLATDIVLVGCTLHYVFICLENPTHLMKLGQLQRPNLQGLPGLGLLCCCVVWDWDFILCCSQFLILVDAFQAFDGMTMASAWAKPMSR